MAKLMNRERAQDSRAIILDAALQLFTLRGFDGTSIDDIRQAAGYRSKASLYTHFKSKEEVANALLTRILEDEEDAVMRAYESAEANAYARLLAMTRAFILWGLLHPREYAFCFLRVQQEAIIGGQFAYLAQRPSESFNMFMVLIAELRKTHAVRAINDAALFTMAIGLISRAVIDTVSFGAISMEEKARQVLEACLGLMFNVAIV